jgi:plasmid maintenance system killer protein
MKSNVLISNIKTAEIHVKRLEYAMKKLASYFPISAEKIMALTDEELETFELYTSRFSKLQDLMGSQLFTLVLTLAGEPADEMTMIDKVHKLEKLKVINSADDWQLMRQIRNHLSHEYPDNPGMTAKYLNQAYTMGFILIKYFKNLVNFQEQLPRN